MLRRLWLTIGSALIILSLAAVVQSVRELLLWEQRGPDYAEESYLKRPLEFAGHTITVRDDQPTDSAHSEAAYEGRIQILMNGEPLGAPSRALVRRGRRDLGRYHLWFDAWQFTERATGQKTLWLARRLQPDPGGSPRYEVVVVDEQGRRQTRVYRGWELGSGYPLFRATQFIRDEWSAFPLSMLDAVFFWPILLLYPLGTLVLGVSLLRRGAQARPLRAAA
jgi:hypothetical protein